MQESTFLQSTDPLPTHTKEQVREEVRRLLKVSGSLYATYYDGKTLLHIAAFYEDHFAVKCILEDKNVDVNAQDEDGSTPLHLAITCRDQSLRSILVRSILEKENVDVNAQDEDGSTPLHLAITCCDQSLRSILVQSILEKENIDVNAQDEDGSTPLHDAVIYGDQDIVKRLLNKGANVDARNKKLETPLHFAAKLNDNIDVATCLLDHEANINTQDEDRVTSLHWAVMNENQDMVKCLLKNNANNALDKKNETLLYLAASSKHEKITQLLLAHGIYCDKDIQVEETVEKWIKGWKQLALLNRDQILCGTTMLLAGLPISNEALPDRLKSVKAGIYTELEQYLSPLKLSYEDFPSVLRVLPQLIRCAERCISFLFWFDKVSPKLPKELTLMIQEELGNMEIIDQTNAHFGNTLLCDCVKHLDRYKAFYTQLWERNWDNEITPTRLSSLTI